MSRQQPLYGVLNTPNLHRLDNPLKKIQIHILMSLDPWQSYIREHLKNILNRWINIRRSGLHHIFNKHFHKALYQSMYSGIQIIIFYKIR